MQVAKNIDGSFENLLSYLACSHIWLNLPVDHRHFGYNANSPQKTFLERDDALAPTRERESEREGGREVVRARAGERERERERERGARDCVGLCVVMGKNMEIFGEILEMESCDSGFCSVLQ
jgi:hypothetical protein